MSIDVKFHLISGRRTAVILLEHAFVIVALISSSQCISATNDFCPSGKVIHVTHMTTGRSAEATQQLNNWISKLKDDPVSSRVANAFAGKICRDDAELFVELKRMLAFGNDSLQAEAVRVLYMHGGEEARMLVRASLSAKSSAVRRNALVGIYYACDKSALSDVERLVSKEGSEEVRSYALTVLESLNGTVPCVGIPGLSPNAIPPHQETLPD